MTGTRILIISVVLCVGAVLLVVLPDRNRDRAARAAAEDIERVPEARELPRQAAAAAAAPAKQPDTPKTQRTRARARSNPEFARTLRDEMNKTPDEALASRYARMLRENRDPDFIAEMVVLATQGTTARARRTAILTLESKDAGTWWGPITGAYQGDESPQVRDEAAGVLSRHLADRRYVQSRDKLRAVIEEELASESAVNRTRAVRALLADRTAGEAQLERVRRLENDEDSAVRREVARYLRVQTPRVTR